MKVNFILPGLGESGGIQVVKKYAQMMNTRGIDTVVYCPIVADNLHRYKSSCMNRVHQLYCTIKSVKEKKRKKDVIWIPYISDKYIRKADHIIATMWATAYGVARLSSKCGKKWYFIQDFEIWDNKKWGLESYRLPLNKLVISTWINNKLKENLDIGPFQIVFNGIDVAIYNAHHRTKHDQITFLMLNHDLEKKGVKQGLEVYRRIQLSLDNTKLRMFGMCSNRNIPSEIEYYQNPSKCELLRLYRDTDIFIFPSLEEGWGLTPLEAMACGCVVVGTNTGFVLDLGKHKNNMMVSEPGDIDGMYNNVCELIDDNRLMQRLKENAYETVRKLDWQCSINRFINLLK